MKKCKINQLNLETTSPVDVLIGCVSYEQRCLSSAASLVDINAEYNLYFKVKEFTQASLENEVKLKEIFKDKLEIIEFSNKKVVDFVDGFSKRVNDIQNTLDRELNLVVDISTFTRESLIIMVGMLYQNRKNISHLYFVYSCASTMSKEWLSRGFRGLRSVLGYPGERSSLKPLHVIIMTGFELERAKHIIDEYEPEVISIGIGDRNESIKPEFYERNERFVEELINHYELGVNRFSFSLVDPYKTANELEKHINKFKDYNTVLAPLNNKVSTVGAAFYALKHNEVQVCYLPAEEYNTKSYSSPGDAIYFEEINLNSI